MNEITRKIKDRALETFRPVIDRMAQEGKSVDEITAFFNNQVRVKAAQYYNQKKPLTHVAKVINEIDLKQDSKAEGIFYDMLIASGVKLKFQHNIGPYRADYLINQEIVLELDGPDHEQAHDDKKDAYLRKMGYKVIRVPVWVLELSPEAVVEEIKEAVG